MTLNYRDAFARGLVYLVGADNKDGIDRTDRIGSLATNWQAGEVIFDGSSRFARLAERTPSLTTPEEPFSSCDSGCASSMVKTRRSRP